jgi:prevent-host-death family protein
MKTVSAAEANRRFSALLRRVAQGERIVVTSRGKPVATLAPPALQRDKVREAARARLLARLKAQPASNVPRSWTRDELYD